MHDQDDARLDDELDADDTDETSDARPSNGAGAAARTSLPLSDAANDLVRFVEYMASNLVDDPGQLEIRPENFGQAIHIKLIVPEEEIGKVIGRQGRIARSMRTLLTIAAARKGLRASLDIDS